jgi:mycofactocin precursor
MTEPARQNLPTSTSAAPEDDRGRPAGEAGASVLIEEELLVEDVSIDGMCGVY